MMAVMEQEGDGVERLALRDGRVLDVRVSGSEAGMPLVFHHGTPGAYPPWRALERATHARGLRFVTFSRPGYGGSTRRPRRSVADVVSDTASVLEGIGAPRCLVGGVSGGGPHALACAARLEAAAAVVVVASVAPYGGEGLDWMAGMGADNVAEFGAALAGEEQLRPFLEAAHQHLKDASLEEMVSSLDSLLPEADKAVLTGELGEDVVIEFREALRTGVDGWFDDDMAFVAPWGFDLDEITRPVALWQGTADLMVPVAHGRWLAERVPDAAVHLEGGEGHMSVGVNFLEKMLDELVEAAG